MEVILTNITGKEMLKKNLLLKLFFIRIIYLNIFWFLEIRNWISRFSIWTQLKLWCEHRFDSIITKAANTVNNTCPNNICSCSNSSNQPFEHWLLGMPNVFLKYHHIKYLNINNTSLNNTNHSTNVNLLNDNCNYNSNCNVENSI